MATSNPAKLAGIDDKIGRLAKNFYADYLVVRPTSASHDVYESLIYAGTRDIVLVSVNGRPLFGDLEVMQKVNPSAKLEKVLVCGARKAVDMSDSDNGKGISFADTLSNLSAAFDSVQIPMSDLCH
jgi:hypothetical protein